MTTHNCISSTDSHPKASMLFSQVGFKPAGGIRTAQESLQWLALIKEELGSDWLCPHLFRIGASSLLADIERQVGEVMTYQTIMFF